MHTFVNKKNSGFTLIELIIVIVLLGLLASAALPRFTDLESKARGASEQGIIGAIRAAIAIAHSAWLANSKPTTVSLDGNIVGMSTQGYPEYTATAGTAGTMTSAKCLEVYSGILSGAPAAGNTCTGNCKVKVTVGTSTAQCNFDFDQGASGKTRAVYDVTTGVVTESTVP
jgi:prepilin-type N-terminal cleavage/methylation domain-containing protein